MDEFATRKKLEELPNKPTIIQVGHQKMKFFFLKQALTPPIWWNFIMIPWLCGFCLPSFVKDDIDACWDQHYFSVVHVKSRRIQWMNQIQNSGRLPKIPWKFACLFWNSPGERRKPKRKLRRVQRRGIWLRKKGQRGLFSYLSCLGLGVAESPVLTVGKWSRSIWVFPKKGIPPNHPF